MHVDVVINDTEMLKIAQSEPEKNGTKDNESFQSKVFQKYLLRHNQGNTPNGGLYHDCDNPFGI